MHEALPADVDADVVDLATIYSEEHQVATLELARLDGFGLLGLVARSARHAESEVTMRVEHEAAAIETVQRRAAVAVTNAAQGQREVRERVAAIAHGGRTAAALPFTLR